MKINTNLNTCLIFLLKNGQGMTPLLLLAFLFSFCGNKKDQQMVPDGFSIAEGFQMELIASEPLVADPVDMVIDEQGRMYVVEMHGYPLDLSGSGKIKLLSDTDNDGKMDESLVFADSLVLPTGIMRWKNGVLVTDPPDILYFEDTNGDGKADKREVILTGFARSNPQHNVNSPRYGLDNWIYLGHEPAVTTVMYLEELGDKGSEIHYPSQPIGPVLPTNAGGRSVRFQPDIYGLERLASKTQFGHATDVWGERFLINNNNHLIHEVLPGRYLGRNPYFPIGNVTQSISDHGNAAEVYPTTANPEHQLLTDVGVMTSASGITPYLGGMFPKPYDKVIFTAEPVSNLVHADIINDKGASFTGSRLFANKEFLTGEDAWFRPVNMYVGPDGALYLIDYHRRIIEHPEWMADEVVQSGALYEGTDKGRIYRISPSGTKKLDWSNALDLNAYTDDQLVAKLADENHWWRMHAQRLLIDRNPKILPAALVDMARNPNLPLGRLHALWTLHGMDKLSMEMVGEALKDPEAGIRKNALVLAEFFPEFMESWKTTLEGMKDDPDPKVRFQLLNTLGTHPTAWANATRTTILLKDIADEWVQMAVLAGANDDQGDLLDQLIQAYQPKPGFANMLEKTASMQAKRAGFSGIKAFLFPLLRQSETLEDWEPYVIKGIASGLNGNEPTGKEWQEMQLAIMEKLTVEMPVNTKDAFLDLLNLSSLPNHPLKKTLANQALESALDTSLGLDERLVNLKMGGLFFNSDDSDKILDLLKPQEPITIQQEVLRLLSQLEKEDYPELLLQHWRSFSPAVREVAVSTLLENKDRIGFLLNNLENGVILAEHIPWGNTVYLMNQKDPKIRNKARALLVASESDKQEVMKTFQASLEMEGLPSEGLRVYEKNCAICHQMTPARGHAYGPDLATLRNRRYENILSDILDPGLSIADGYDLWNLELKSGETLQGIISQETPTAITLSQAGGISTTIARSAIIEMNALSLSGMSQGLERQVSVEEMADLLAFIKKGLPDS